MQRVLALAATVPAWAQALQGRHLLAAFLFHFFVMAVVISVTFGILAHTYFRYVQRPRLTMITDVYGANLAGLTDAIQSLPAPVRDAYVDSLEHFGSGLIAADDPQQWGLDHPASQLAEEFFSDIRAMLPGFQIGFTKGNRPLLWIAIPTHQASLRWIRIDVPNFVIMPMFESIAALLLVVITASAGSAYLIVRARRRIAWMAHALDSMDPNAAHSAHTPPVHGAADVLDVDRHFRQMAARVSKAHSERASLIAGVACDLAPLLQRLRASHARASTPAEVQRCVDDMERAIDQFSLFAQRSDARPTQSLDLNAMLTALAMQSSTRGASVSTQLEAVPPVNLSPTAARRIVGNLLDNVIRYAGGCAIVTSSLNDSWVVVRVLDRGPGVTDNEVALLGRPFYRTEAARARCAGSGLGLAIARQEVGAHGGTLRVAMRPGGGLQAEVWVRPAGPAPAGEMQ